MKLLKEIGFVFVLLVLVVSCKKEAKKQEKLTRTIQEELEEIKPLTSIKLIDSLLSKQKEIQRFMVNSGKSSVIRGKRGTIIYFEPKNLRTANGGKIPSNVTVTVELIELHQKSEFIWNNAPTVSNNNLLVSGGAYYINMTLNGENLQLNKAGLKVEFPKLSKKEMFLFLGERDSLNQMNWIPVKEKFLVKRIPVPKKPIRAKEEIAAEIATIDYNESGSIKEQIVRKPKKVRKEDVTDIEYQVYLKALNNYYRKLKERKEKLKTYNAIKILNFGWINVDRFYRPETPKRTLFFKIENEIAEAKLYVVFKNLNSIVSKTYFKHTKKNIEFTSIPLNEEITIVAIALENEQPLYVEKGVDFSTDSIVELELKPITEVELKERILRLK
ncbi:hypothetical protein [Wenyingzhuangia sp. IMCC45574]